VTYALNLAIRGLLRPGDRVVTTGIEHNAVMRPLRALERRGLRLVVVPCDREGFVDLDAMAQAITSETRLVIVNHGSNVIGTIAPLAEIGALTRASGALLLVDSAQTAGVVPIDMEAMRIDLLAFTGHKGLQGPPGIGGLIVGERVPIDEFEPLVRGGTGSRSEEEEQPEMLPDRFESGTVNGPAIAGLLAGLRFVQERGLEAIRAHEQALTRQLVEGLEAIPGVIVYGPRDIARRTAVVSFTAAGRLVSDIGLRLDEEHEVLCRVGLHCSPASHRTIGTFPEGTVRLAPGVFTTQAEIGQVVRAVREVVNS